MQLGSVLNKYFPDEALQTLARVADIDSPSLHTLREEVETHAQVLLAHQPAFQLTDVAGSLPRFPSVVDVLKNADESTRLLQAGELLVPHFIKSAEPLPPSQARFVSLTTPLLISYLAREGLIEA